MSRGVLIIIVIVLVLAIVGVGLALFWQPNILNRNQGDDNANATPVTNTNTKPTINADLGFTAEVLENRDVNGAVTYREQAIQIERVEITNGLTFTGKAPSGKKYVVVHFDRDVFTYSRKLQSWLGQEIRLLDGSGNSYEYRSAVFSPPGEENVPEERYISFLVNEDASDFDLRFVRDGEDRSLDLGL
ncbi:MAG: hypothetical protein HY340_03030 [Candidatus Kerfeldbacteria bacterium]|nr:hypothetical protein [Candidatus Kerfeldbacteria bacterium]